MPSALGLFLYGKDASEGTDDEEGEADKEDGEVDDFRLDVFLVEDEHAVEE